MQLSKSFFFRLITKIVLISYIHAVFYPIYAGDQQLSNPPALPKVKPLYSVKVEKIMPSESSHAPVSPSALQTLKVTIKELVANDKTEKKADLKTSSTLNTPNQTIKILRTSFELNPATTDLNTYDYLSHKGALKLTNSISWNLDENHSIFIFWDGKVSISSRQPPLSSALSLKVKTFNSALIKNTYTKYMRLVGNNINIDGKNVIDYFDLKIDNRYGWNQCISITEAGHLTTKVLQADGPRIQNSGTIAVTEAARLDVTRLINSKSGKFHATTITKVPFTLTNEGEIILQKILDTRFISEIDNSGTLSFVPADPTDIRYKIKGLDAQAEERIRLRTRKIKNTGTLSSVQSLDLEATENIDNSQGKITSPAEVTVNTQSLKNKQGLIGGAQGTTVTIKKTVQTDSLFLRALKEWQPSGTGILFDNDQGIIGGGERTLLRFEEIIKQAKLGLIEGDIAILQDLTKDSEARFEGGLIRGKKHVQFVGHIMLFPGTEIETPTLYLSLYDFLITSKKSPNLTVIERSEKENLRLTHDYTTAGKLQISEDYQEISEESAKQAMKKRFGENYEKRPSTTHQLEIFANIRADQGMLISAPAARFHFGSEALAALYGLGLEKTFLKAFVSEFDFEKGILPATQCIVHAPLGIHLGRLVRDPQRDILAVLKNVSGAKLSLFWNAAANGTYEFLDNKLSYHRERVPLFPYATVNETYIDIVSTTELHGPLIHHGKLKTKNLSLNSLMDDSVIEAGQAIVEGDFHLKGNLFLKRYIGKFKIPSTGVGYKFKILDRIDCTFCNPSFCEPNNFCYSFSSSDPAELSIYGKLYVELQSKILNEASNLYSHYVRPLANIEEQEFRSSMPQKIVTKNDMQKVVEYRQTLKEISHDAQQVFLPNTSSSNPIILSPEAAKLRGNITAPLLLSLIGQKDVEIGLSHPTYVSKEHFLRDLSVKNLNPAQVYVTPHLRQLIDAAHRPHAIFALRERFHFHEQEAQAFYQDLNDHIVVAHRKEGISKKSGKLVFNMSPRILLESVRRECQAVLRSGHFPGGQVIDLEAIKQYHRNASQYIEAQGLLHKSSSKALMLIGQNKQLPSPTQPMIFYQTLTNDEGIEQLMPLLIIPPKMIEDTHNPRGSLLLVNHLLLCPEDVWQQQGLQFYEKLPQAQKLLEEAFKVHKLSLPGIKEPLAIEDKPKRKAAHFADEVGAPLVQVKMIPSRPKNKDEAPQQALAIKPDPKAAQDVIEKQPDAVPPTPPRPTVTLKGKVKSDEVAAINHGDIMVTGDIEAAKNVLLQSFEGNIHIKTLIEREFFANGFRDLPINARVAALEGFLWIVAGQDILFQGAKTFSDKGTYMDALGSIYSLSQELVSQTIQHFEEKRKSTTITTTMIDHALTQHTSNTSIEQIALDKIVMAGAIHSAPKTHLTGAQGILGQELHRILRLKIEESIRKSKLLSSSTKNSTTDITSYSSVANAFHSDEIILTTHTGNIQIHHPVIKPFTAQKIPHTTINALKGVVELLVGVNIYEEQYVSQYRNTYWQSQYKSSQHHKTHQDLDIEGVVDINAQRTIVQLVNGHVVPEFVKQLQEADPNNLILNFLNDEHHHEDKRIAGPSAALSTFVGIAIAAITWGADGGESLATLLKLGKGAAAVAGCSAAVGCISMQLANSLMSNRGNLGKALKSLTDKDFIKDFITNVASAVLTAGICSKLDIKPPSAAELKGVPPGPGVQAVAPLSRGEALMRHLKYNAVGSFVHQTLDVAGGKDIRTAVRDGLHNTTTNTLAAFAANQIGLAYFDKDINFFEHKCLHGALGAAVGAMMSPKDAAKGALSGAFAGVMSEIIGELLLDSPAEVMQAAMEKGDTDTMENFLKRYDVEAQKAAEIAKVITGAVSLATGLDMEVSSYVANNALKNNMQVALRLLAIEQYASMAVAGALRTHIGLAVLQATSIATLMEQAKDGPLKHLSEKEWQSLSTWWQANQNLEGGAGVSDLPKDVERALGSNGPATMWMVLNEIEKISAKVGIKDASAQPKASVKPASPTPQAPMPNGLEPDDKDKGKDDPKPPKKVEREPASLQDEMALEAAKRGEGDRIMEGLNDPKYKGMDKYELKVKSDTGKDSVVHYVKDPKTGKLMDFKFKKRSID